MPTFLASYFKRFKYSMKLFFGDDISVPIHLNTTPLSLAFQKVMKNLQHAPIPFREWDNPYYLHTLDYETRCCRLVEFGKILGITVDLPRLLVRDQLYFNELHKIYENEYPKSKGNPQWLDYHEFIHLCEFYSPKRRHWVSLNYRERGGLVEQPMNPEWLETLTTTVPKGGVYIIWSELGKSPFHYWENKEPEDIDRMCQLAKPWLIFKPQVHITFKDIDGSHRATPEQRTEFNAWWNKYKEPWCKHWGLKSWDLDQQFGFNIIGHINELDNLQTLLANYQNPTYLKL